MPSGSPSSVSELLYPSESSPSGGVQVEALHAQPPVVVQDVKDGMDRQSTAEKYANWYVLVEKEREQRYIYYTSRYYYTILWRGGGGGGGGLWC